MSGSWPIHPCQSLRHSPVASTRTTTPPVGGAGSGTSLTSARSPNRSNTTARMPTAFRSARLPARYPRASRAPPRVCLKAPSLRRAVPGPGQGEDPGADQGDAQQLGEQPPLGPQVFLVQQDAEGDADARVAEGQRGL